MTTDKLIQRLLRRGKRSIEHILVEGQHPSVRGSHDTEDALTCEARVATWHWLVPDGFIDGLCALREQAQQSLESSLRLHVPVPSEAASIVVEGSFWATPSYSPEGPASQAQSRTLGVSA